MAIIQFVICWIGRAFLPDSESWKVLRLLIFGNMLLTAARINECISDNGYALSFAYCWMYEDPSVQIHAGLFFVELSLDGFFIQAYIPAYYSICPLSHLGWYWKCYCVKLLSEAIIFVCVFLEEFTFLEPMYYVSSLSWHSGQVESVLRPQRCKSL